MFPIYTYTHIHIHVYKPIYYICIITYLNMNEQQIKY